MQASTVVRETQNIKGQMALDMEAGVFQTTQLSHRTRAFRVELKKDEDGRVVLTSPDLPGLVTDGADSREAIMNAFEAVQAILESQGENLKDVAISLIHKSGS